MKLGLVNPPWQEMPGEPLVSSYQALPLLSSLCSLDYTFRDLTAASSLHSSWKSLWIRMDFQSLILRIR